jgi:hypothetical protein
VIHPPQQLVVIDDLRVLDILPRCRALRVKEPDDFLVALRAAPSRLGMMTAEFTDGGPQPRAGRPADTVLAVHWP